MFQFIGQCWRDMWRNRRRTILTGLVMVFAVLMMVLFVALGDGSHTQMIKAATDSFVGHGQVQYKGFMDEPDLEHVIPAPDLEKVLGLLPDAPGVVGFAPRIDSGGLISKKVPPPLDENDLDAYREMTSEGAFLVGIRPAMERTVSILEKGLVDDDPADRCLRGCRAGLGEIYADTARCPEICAGSAGGFAGDACLSAGKKACLGQCDPADDLCVEADCTDRYAGFCEPARFLADVDPNPDEQFRGEVVLGSGLAKVLDVGVGNLVALTTGTSKGRIFASLYRIVGTVKTGSLDINRTFAMTHYGKLARGLEVPGAATTLVLAMDDLDGANGIAAKLDARLEKNGLNDLDALSWRETIPEMDIFVKIDQGSMMVMLALMVMIVGVILANVVTMSVMERTREYGVRLALGESPGRITAGLITEMTLLAGLASTVGAALGEILNLYYASAGIDFGMGEIEAAGVLLNTVYYTEFTWYGLFFSVGLVMFYALLGSLIPAFRIRRLKPVEALRFV